MGYKADLAGFIEYPNNDILLEKIEKLVQYDWIKSDPNTNQQTFYTDIGTGEFKIDNGKISFDLISANKLSRILQTLTYNDAIDYRIIKSYEDEDLSVETPYCDIVFHVYNDEAKLFFKDKIENELSFQDWIDINNKYSDIETIIGKYDYYNGINIYDLSTFNDNNDILFELMDESGYSDYPNTMFYKKFDYLYKELDDRILIKNSAGLFLIKNGFSNFADEFFKIEYANHNEDVLKIEIFKYLYKIQYKMDDISKYSYLKNLKNYTEKIKVDLSLLKSDKDIDISKI
jgi:hypothetical protein